MKKEDVIKHLKDLILEVKRIKQPYKDIQVYAHINEKSSISDVIIK